MTGKIVIWTENYFPTIGGTEIALKRQVEWFAKKGFDIEIITPDLNCRSLDRVSPVESSPDGIKEARDLIKNYSDIDILYVSRIFHTNTELFLQALQTVSKTNTTFLRVPTTGDVLRFKNHNLKDYLDSVDAILSLNNYTTIRLRSKFPEMNIVDHRNGIPRDFYENKFEQSGPIVYAGRIAKSNGIEILLESWMTYKREGGDESLHIYAVERDPIEVPRLFNPEWRQEYDVTLFNGSYPLWESIESAKSIVMPSRREGHSNLMLESMAVGIPVIASRVPGLKSDIKQSGCGLLFDPENQDALVETFWTIEQSSSQDLEDMGLSGIDFVRSKRSIASIGEGILELAE